jgi:hypothetical protein
MKLRISKSKCEIVLVPAMKAYIGSKSMTPYSYLRQLHAPAALRPEKEPSVLIQ